MFMRITNIDDILHTHTCCECEQEISPNVDLRLGARIPTLRIRIRTGGPICATDLRCTQVYIAYVKAAMLLGALAHIVSLSNLFKTRSNARLGKRYPCTFKLPDIKVSGKAQTFFSKP
jgi:hypothetical protein